MITSLYVRIIELELVHSHKIWYVVAPVFDLLLNLDPLYFGSTSFRHDTSNRSVAIEMYGGIYGTDMWVLI